MQSLNTWRISPVKTVHRKAPRYRDEHNTRMGGEAARRFSLIVSESPNAGLARADRGGSAGARGQHFTRDTILHGDYR